MNAQKTIHGNKNENAAMIHSMVYAGVHFLIGIIICRGTVFSSLAPFGASYTASVPRKNLIWAVLGTSVGYILLNPIHPFRYVAVTISIAVIRWTAEDIKFLRRSVFFAPAVAFLPIFASGLIMLTASTSTIGDLTTVFVEAVLSAAAAFFLSRSISLVNEGRKLSGFSNSELATLAMSGCVLLLSLGGLQIENVSIGRIIAVMIILLCARYGSAVGGAVAGAATGAAFGISDTGFAFICAGYSLGGLVGGMISALGKGFVAAAFVLGNSIMLLSSGDRQVMTPVFIETVIAAAAFMVLPREFEGYVTPIFLPKEMSRGERSLKNSVVMRLDFAASALKNVTGCVNSVSRELKKLYAPNVSSVYQNAVDEVCENCGLRVYCWERRKNTTANDFERLSAPLRSQGFVTEGDVESLFSKKCCRPIEISDSINRGYSDYLGGIEAAKRIGEIRALVAGQFSGLSEILSDMAGEFENYKSFDADSSARVIEYLRSEGMQPSECGCMIDANGRMSVEIRLENSGSAIKRNTLAKNISIICGRCFDTPAVSQLGTQLRVVLSEIPSFDVEVGVFQHVFQRGKLCGDCVKCFSTGFGEFAALISDGMGTGGRAAVDSNMTVSIMSKLMKAGLSANCALKVVNSALMVKSEDESLSTVDLLRVDLFNGKAVFNKAGAPFSFVKKGNHIFKKTATSLPIGILGEVEFSAEKARLSGGDVVVMLSDGAFGCDEKWLETLIRNFEDGRCSDLAKQVVNEAIKRRNDGHDDDITAVVIKIIENN